MGKADYIFTLTFAAEVCLKVGIFLFIVRIIIRKVASVVEAPSSLVVH